MELVCAFMFLSNWPQKIRVRGHHQTAQPITPWPWDSPACWALETLRSFQGPASQEDETKRRDLGVTIAVMAMVHRYLVSGQ